MVSKNYKSLDQTCRKVCICINDYNNEQKVEALNKVVAPELKTTVRQLSDETLCYYETLPNRKCIDRKCSSCGTKRIQLKYVESLLGNEMTTTKFYQVEKLTYDKNSSPRFKIIKRHETELKWIKLLQTPFPLGFNDNIYHEGKISKMPDFDVFSLLEIRKRKSRSHGIRKKGNGKRKKCAVKRSNTSLKDLSKVLENHGRHSMLSFLSSLPISVLRILDTEANKFYDRNHQLYDAALLTRCYTQHALRPFIDSETNHKRHFIKIPFINKGIEFIDLPSIFKDRSVTSSIPAYFQNSEPPIICYKYNKPIRNTVFNFNKLVSELDIHANTPKS